VFSGAAAGRDAEAGRQRPIFRGAWANYNPKTRKREKKTYDQTRKKKKIISGRRTGLLERGNAQSARKNQGKPKNRRQSAGPLDGERISTDSGWVPVGKGKPVGEKYDKPLPMAKKNTEN